MKYRRFGRLGWQVSENLDDFQAFASDVLSTDLGGYLATPHHYLSMTKHSTYVDEHRHPLPLVAYLNLTASVQFPRRCRPESFVPTYTRRSPPQVRPPRHGCLAPESRTHETCRSSRQVFRKGR